MKVKSKITSRRIGVKAGETYELIRSFGGTYMIRNSRRSTISVNTEDFEPVGLYKFFVNLKLYFTLKK